MKSIVSLFQKILFKNGLNNNKIFYSFFVFNIGVNTLLLLNTILLIYDYDILFGCLSPLKTEYLDIVSNAYAFNALIMAKYFEGTVNKIMFIMFFFLIILGLCNILIIDKYKKFSLLLTFTIYQIFYRTYYNFYVYGYDSYMLMSYLYLILFYFFEQDFSRILIFKTFQLHVAGSYFISGVTKLMGYNWRNGESIWKALHLYYLPNSYLVRKIEFLLQDTAALIGWYVIIIQILMPLLLINRLNNSVKHFILYSNLFIHLLIGIFLNLPFFASIMIIWNTTAFYFAYEKKSNHTYEKKSNY